MTELSAIFAILFVVGILAYRRAPLWLWSAALAIVMVVYTQTSGVGFGAILGWIVLLGIFVPLNIKPLRRKFISARALKIFKKSMPTMSRTEREAISAGTVSWEGDLFRGDPDWSKLLKLPEAKLTAEEQAFIDGPVDTLCSMICDWDITHNRADLPPEMWQFLKDHGFFGLIIPKEYGGKGFSAYAHSQILVKISGRSITASTTVAVPNSLGPAELLLEYGTQEQKKYYLPRLASGDEVPCFALTSPVAGSDASAMTDYGIVCWGEHEGKKTLGMRVSWDKRYITLAPVATVIALAFKLYDPDNLLGGESDIGITCALIPTRTPGVKIGRRHFPLNTPFQNGPTQGKDVFIPLEWIIGGKNQAGNGWRMLMECLAGGRAITLPSSSVGGAKVIAYATGAYARIRKQFHVPIAMFEGIEEPLARIGAYTYIMDAARTFASGAINHGEKPSVASAIVKYHVTEMGRMITQDAMDIHGGKAICLGPKNYLGRGYESVPISITVEGANILTRNLIIFGQGAIRCHPYVYREIQAAQLPNAEQSLKQFDDAIMKHIGFVFSNIVRSLVLGVTGSLIVRAPKGRTKRYFQHATRFSSAFALLADVAMIHLGGRLKRKENISARLGDILSYLYLLSATLKQYHDQGRQSEDLPLVHSACQYCLFQTQERFKEILTNYPSKIVAMILRVLIFPLGANFARPKDKFNRKITKLFTAPTATRERLATGAYLTPDKQNAMADIEDALIKSIAAEPMEKAIREGVKQGTITSDSLADKAREALEKKILTREDYDVVMAADEARKKVIAVDDFSPEELAINHPMQMNAGTDVKQSEQS
jgi:acyl-CoA dehydrogenase